MPKCMKILADLGVEDRPRLQVFNKIDALAPEIWPTLVKANGRNENKVFTSGVTGAGLTELLARIDAVLPTDPLVHVHLRIPISDGRHLSLVHACGSVLRTEKFSTVSWLIEAEIPESLGALASKTSRFRLAPGRSTLSLEMATRKSTEFLGPRASFIDPLMRFAVENSSSSVEIVVEKDPSKSGRGLPFKLGNFPTPGPSPS